MLFQEVEAPLEPVKIEPSGTPPGGSQHSYYLCYACPEANKKRALFYAGGHHYCREHIEEFITKLGNADDNPQ